MITTKYEDVFRNILYPLYETTIRRRKTFEYYEEYETNQWRTIDEINAIQFRKLKKLLDHCNQNVPFYSQKWKKIGFSPNDIKSLDDYRELPILNKETIMGHYDDFIAKNYVNRTRSKSTGGSTGRPLRFEFDYESDQRRNAVMWRGYKWAGAVMGRKSLYLWGTSIVDEGFGKILKAKCYNFFLRRKILNCFVLSIWNIQEYIDKINRYRPVNLIGYVSPLMVVGKFIKDGSVDVVKIHSVLTGAETLHEFQRKLLEEVFECPVYNTYGCREFMLVACECEKQQGLHINADHLLVETVNSQNKEVFGKTGNIVITDLHNYGMPFIRYLNGDLAELSDKICSCGRGLPMMTSIQGRELDIIRTPDGRIVPGEFFPHLMKEVAAVQEFQVVQLKLDEIKIYLVPKCGLSETDEKFLRRKIRSTLGGKININFEYIDRIPRTESGKLRVTLSCLPDQ